VVRNLLTNAVHHSPDGGRVAVRVIPGGEGVAIEVEDDGNGIAPGDLPRIFDRLWRADTSRSRAAGRHGLGLALARRHADLLGAELEVRSELGRGTTMVVRLD
jgi:two-component system sensor histidine kinase BaeS